MPKRKRPEPRRADGGTGTSVERQDHITYRTATQDAVDATLRAINAGRVELAGQFARLAASCSRRLDGAS